MNDKVQNKILTAYNCIGATNLLARLVIKACISNNTANLLLNLKFKTINIHKFIYAMITIKKHTTIILLSLLPCILWGLLSYISIILNDTITYTAFLTEYSVYRLLYLLRALAFLPMLMHIYKKYLPRLLYSYQNVYRTYSILSLISIFCGLFVKTNFWNYILDGCLVSPLIEELIARFILYEARYRGFKMYILVAITTSLSFGLMHFGYEPSALLDTPNIIPKLSLHVGFGLMLCGVFWFKPSLSLLTILHSLTNLYLILLN
mgnify:CR=1 FL=1